MLPSPAIPPSPAASLVHGLGRSGGVVSLVAIWITVLQVASFRLSRFGSRYVPSFRTLRASSKPKAPGSPDSVRAMALPSNRSAMKRAASKSPPAARAMSTSAISLALSSESNRRERLLSTAESAGGHEPRFPHDAPSDPDLP
jgi:hypothetical protein